MKQAYIKASVAMAIVACMAVSAMANTVTIDGKQFNVCQDASKAGGPDAYARKWGWEGNSSCVVPATINSTGCTYTVEKFQKCGGSGGNNAVDAGACCTSGYYCARVNQWHWQCEASNAPVVNGTVNGTAAAPVTMIIDGKTYPVCANPAAAGAPDAYNRRWGWENGQTCVVPPPGVMPVGVNSTTPVVNGSYSGPVNSTGCKYTVAKWEKCGGSGGNNRPDDGACCTSGYFCARINNWHWQCEASTGTNTTTVVVTGTINLDGKSVPLCTNAAAANVMDKQGRKWGWENNQSCIVIS